MKQSQADELSALKRGKAFADAMPQLGEKWSQAQAVAFECAREVITDMMAIHTSQIAEENAKRRPDPARVAQLRAERSRLAQERAGLHVDDDATIARIRAEYGAAVRAWRAGHHSAAA